MSFVHAPATTASVSPIRPPTLELPLMTSFATQHKGPPLICEQGPSAPASPTSPATRQRRLCPPLTLEAMHRINLLTAGYSHDFGKLSPVSPNYPTSDLGSSPRSSISVPSGLGPWTAYREQNKSSFDLDDKDLNSPGFLLSPAPYSPFSDGEETPLSIFARSPNLSPNISTAFQHFSFDPVRSSSSMSNRHHLLVPSTSLDEQSRERSRSESDMSPIEERMDPHSTISVPVATNSAQYKKRLLQKYQQEERKRPRSSSSPPPSMTGSEAGSESDLRSVSRASPPPHLAQPPPSATLHAALPSTAAVNGWIESQMSLLNNVLLQMPRPQLLVPPEDHTSRLLQREPTIEEGGGPLKSATLWRRSRSETDVSRQQQPIAHNFANGVFACSTCGAGFSCHDRLAKHIASRHRDRSATASLDEGAKIHKCTQCPKKFTRSDMLTRHMRLHTGAKPYECNQCGQVFSRSDHLSTHQRTHTGEKPYQCSKCSYTASRRDMITRHFRTHDAREGDVNLCRLSLSTPSPVPPGTLGPAGFPVPLLQAPPTSPLPLPLALLSLNPAPNLTAPSLAPNLISSGEKSAFAPPPNRLLAPPPLMHSLSVPSSPVFSRQNSLSPAFSRQSSIGGYDTPCGGV